MMYAGGGGGGGAGASASLAPFSPPSPSSDVFFRDCSVRTCTIYCPQWCTYIFPPPPPEDSSARFPPLFIALIGVLAGAFLLVCYYAVVSRYCRGRRRRLRRVREGESGADPDGSDPDRGHPWLAPEAAPAGLDEAVVKSIAVHKYRRDDGSVEGTDCSVCLGEFREEESLRLLPKCNHAFHVACIDAWFKSHSNCPLCRSDLAAPTVCHPAEPAPAAAVRPSTPPVVAPGPHDPPLQIHPGGDAAASAAEDIERGGGGRADDDETIVVVITNGHTDAAAPRKRSGEAGNETRPKERVGGLSTRSGSVNNSQSTTEVVIFSGEERQIHGPSLMGAGSSRQHSEDEKTKGRNMGSVSDEQHHSKGEKSGVSNIPNRQVGIVVQK